MNKGEVKQKARARSYNNAHLYQMWIDTNGRCPICKVGLIALSQLNENGEYKKSKQHIGEIAHIISFGRLKYNGILVRPNNIKYDGEIVSESFFDEEKVQYKERFLNSYENLVVLCSSCHKSIDGRKENIIGKSLLCKSNELQIKELKSYKPQKSDVNYKIANIPPITIRGNEEWEQIFPLVSAISKELEISGEDFRIDSFSFDYFEMNGFVELFKKLETNQKWEEKHRIFFDESMKRGFFKENDIKIFFTNHPARGVTFSAMAKGVSSISQEELKDKKTLKKNIENIYEGNSEWIINVPFEKPEFKDKPEYKLIKDLLLTQLQTFAKTDLKTFNSMSIAYMARWGTGKTSIIRSLTNELSDFFNVVEINLWHISNSLNDDSKDNTFVRQIVKETITQLSNDPDLVDKYMNSKSRSSKISNEFDVKRKMLDSLIDFPENTKPEILMKERAKFIDQHISLISRITQSIFNTTLKPTIFVFDDIDRVEDDEKVVGILDSLVAFLSLKNSVYIIPMDEAKVMKSISSVKVGKDPYSFMNKYFTYSVRVPFMPRLNSLSLIKEVMKENNIAENEEWMLIASQLFPTTYRGIKDYLNSYNSCKTILENNSFFNRLIGTAKINEEGIVTKRNQVILFASIMQINFPLITDYLSEDLKRKDDLFLLEVELGKAKPLEIVISRLQKTFEETNDATIPVRSSSFWGALLNLDLEEKDFANYVELVKSIESSIANMAPHDDSNIKNEEIRKMAIKKSYFLMKIFDSFNIQTINSTGKLLFWTAMTLANITDKKAMEFAESIDFHRILISENFNEEYLKMLEESNE